MKRTNANRLKKVASHLAVVPIAPDVVRDAFVKFKEFGELPEHQRLADLVVQRALRPYVTEYGSVCVVAQARQVVEELVANTRRSAEGIEPPEDLRKSLFYEALSEDDKLMRFAARHAIKALVHMGQDVTAKDFVPEDIEMPDFGTVGLHLIGWPEMFAKPPYVEQAHRLFARFDDLRARMPRDDEEWMGRLYAAWREFERDGALPDDELMAEGALALAEAFELMRCFVGKGNAERMWEFDRTAG